MATPKIHKFRTVNNKLDPSQLAMDEMTKGQNVDLNNRGGITLRPGRAVVEAMSSPHSMWASDNTALYGQGGVLKRFWESGVSTSLLTLSNDNPLSFEQVNNIVMFSNGIDIGYVQDGVATLVGTPTEQFKIPVVAGRFLALYNGRLFALNEDGLYYTDPYTVDQMDERNCLIPLLGAPTMLAALDGGLWVGKGDKTIWLAGGNPEAFTYAEFDSAVVPGTAVVNHSPEHFGLKSSKKFALWASQHGICIGDDSGAYTVLTEDFLAVKQAQSGAAIIREVGGLAHYIVALQDTSPALNQYTSASITVDSQTTGG